MLDGKTLYMCADQYLRWEHEGTDYVLHVLQDDAPMNPREDRENIANLICFHSRYCLGDEHKEKTALEYLQHLVAENVPSDNIFAAAYEGKLPGIRVSFATKYHEYNLYNIYEMCEYRTVLGDTEPKEELVYAEVNEGVIVDYLIDELTERHCLSLLKPYMEWEFLYLFDHGEITISCGDTNPYYDRWDSGCVGFAYVTKKRLDKYGFPDGNEDPTWRERARGVIEAEVKEYDYYISGENYGYKLLELHPDDENGEENWIEIDSCWGYLGDDIIASGLLEDVKKETGLAEAIEKDEYKKGNVTEHKHVCYTYSYD